MNKCLTLILLSLYSIEVIGQFETIEWNWEEVKYSQQIRLWSNDSLKIENRLVEDRLTRFQYYDDGSIMLCAEIEQIRKVDSLITYLNGPDEISSIKLIKIFKDIPNGSFNKYFKSGKLEAQGRRNGIGKVGKWLFFYQNGQLKSTINYNEDGLMKGEFLEYHENGQLKMSGIYDLKDIIKESICFNPETFEEYKCEIVETIEIKTGKWEHFDKDGNKIKR